MAAWASPAKIARLVGPTEAAGDNMVEVEPLAPRLATTAAGGRWRRRPQPLPRRAVALRRRRSPIPRARGGRTPAGGSVRGGTKWHFGNEKPAGMGSGRACSRVWQFLPLTCPRVNILSPRGIRRPDLGPGRPSRTRPEPTSNRQVSARNGTQAPLPAHAARPCRARARARGQTWCGSRSRPRLSAG